MYSLALVLLCGASPDVALLTASATEDNLPALETQLRAALVTANVEVIDIPQRWKAASPIDEGKSLVSAARLAYDELDFESAATRWGHVLEFYAAHPEQASVATLAEAHFYAGVLLLLNQGKKAHATARELFAQALIYAPNFSFDNRSFDATVNASFARAKTENSERAVGALTLDLGDGIRVRVDEHEPTSVKALTLAVGRHLLRFERPGYNSKSQFVEVAESGAAVTATLQPLEPYAAFLKRSAALVRGASKDAASVATELNVRFLILADGATATVIDVAQNRRLTGLTLSTAQLPKTTEAIKRFIAPPSALAQNPALTPTPVHHTWWFWTAVGAAVAGGVAAGLVIDAQPHSPDVILGIP